MSKPPPKPKGVNLTVMNRHKAGLTVEQIERVTKLPRVIIERIIKLHTPASERCPPGFDPVRWAKQCALTNTSKTVSLEGLQRLEHYAGGSQKSAPERAADIEALRHKMNQKDEA